MRIACVLDNDFEDSEYARPVAALRKAGHDVCVVGRQKGLRLTGKAGRETAEADAGIADVDSSEFEALFVPGGFSPDHLRADDRFVRFASAFAENDRPIMAICHGPQLLSAADAIRGRRLTAWKTVQGDLQRMGERVADREVVVDTGLVTSRQPDDIPAFNEACLEVLSHVPASTR